MRIIRPVWNNRWAVGLTVFVICLLVSLQLYHENQISQVKAAAFVVCNTGNELRDQLNERGTVQKKFFTSAAVVREKSARLAEKKDHPEQARIDRIAAREYRAAVKAFPKIPAINCDASYHAKRTIYKRSEK